MQYSYCILLDEKYWTEIKNNIANSKKDSSKIQFSLNG